METLIKTLRLNKIKTFIKTTTTNFKTKENKNSSLSKQTKNLNTKETNQLEIQTKLTDTTELACIKTRTMTRKSVRGLSLHPKISSWQETIQVSI